MVMNGQSKGQCNAIPACLAAVQARISQAERDFERPPGSITLLAVSKAHGTDEVGAAIAAGQRCFGESYVQEALPKMEVLASNDLEWHYIGPIQSNKTKVIASAFAWVHSIERFKIARRLNDQRPGYLPRLNICIQVNVSREQSKAGIMIDEITGFAKQVALLPRLQLRGLMAIPAPGDEFNLQRIPYRVVHQAWMELRYNGLELDTLSMGMSKDLEAAIAEGATMVRVGSAIFGARVKI